MTIMKYSHQVAVQNCLSGTIVQRFKPSIRLKWCTIFYIRVHDICSRVVSWWITLRWRNNVGKVVVVQLSTGTMTDWCYRILRVKYQVFHPYDQQWIWTFIVKLIALLYTKTTVAILSIDIPVVMNRMFIVFAVPIIPQMWNRSICFYPCSILYCYWVVKRCVH